MLSQIQLASFTTDGGELSFSRFQMLSEPRSLWRNHPV
jgi:hypothetical protein